MEITGFYAGILGLIFVALSARVVGSRIRNRVRLGDGGNDDLVRRIRAHGNFSEYVPVALILTGLLEAQGTAAWSLHALGAALVTGRALYAYAITKDSIGLRKAGMVLTLGPIAAASLAAIAGFLFS